MNLQIAGTNTNEVLDPKDPPRVAKKNKRSTDLTHLKSKHPVDSQSNGRYYIRQSHRMENPEDPIQKPSIDLYYILRRAGYRPLNSTNIQGAIGKVVATMLLIAGILFQVRKGNIVVFNLPANYKLMKAVYFLKRVIRFKLVVHCYDIPSIRYTSPMRLSSEEKNMMNWCDIVLTPGINTESILRPLGLTSICVPVEVWDYIYPSDVTSAEGDGRVAFAGNPHKAAFLSQLGELSTPVTLWANSYHSDSSNVLSLGMGVSPENLRDLAQSGWGLVWDGESIDGSKTGPLGNYTKVMTTHKGGLYLAAGLPIIVWSQGGMAPFVNKYKVGICVDSLRELDILLPALPVSQYKEYRQNARKISHKIRTGHFLKQALYGAELENAAAS